MNDNARIQSALLSNDLPHIATLEDERLTMTENPLSPIDQCRSPQGKTLPPEDEKQKTTSDSFPPDKDDTPFKKNEEQYKVNVTHYAQYDQTDNGYPSSVEKQIEYAARDPFSRFFIDFFTTLFRPAAFWKSQTEHPATLGQLHFPHLFILVILRSAAVFAGSALQDDAKFVEAIVSASIQGVLIFVLVWLLALLFSAITALTGGKLHFKRALLFVGYGITPLLFIGLLGAIPIPYLATICDLLAMPWAFAVMGYGVLPFLRINPEKAPIATSLFCGSLLFMWGAIPILIPFLFLFL